MGTITISATVGSKQGSISAGTLTHSEAFSDAGLASDFATWLYGIPYYWPSADITKPYVPAPMSDANLNTAFQAWAAAIVASTKTAVTQNKQAAAAATAMAAVAPVS